MNTLKLNEPLPRPARVQTALVKAEPLEIITTEPTVSELSSQTVGEIELTDPTVQTVHELAPIVIQAFGKIRTAIPHILTFFRKCKELERDENNRWLEPVEGCYSVKEFCEKKLFRSPSAIYKAVREAQPKVTDGKPKPPKQGSTSPAGTTNIAELPAAVQAEILKKIKEDEEEDARILATKTEAALLAAREEAKREEKQVQKIVAEKVTNAAALALLEAQDVILAMTRLTAESKVRKIGVKYCKAHNIDMTCPPPESPKQKKRQKSAAEIAVELPEGLQRETAVV